jgi:cell division protein FtsW (lipid II flippase)
MRRLTPRNREALFLALSVALVEFAVLLLRYSGNPSVQIKPWAYPIAGGGSFLAMHIANRILAKNASSFLLPPVAFLHGTGFVIISRLASEKATAQLWWTAAAAAAYVAVLLVLRDYRLIDRFRYIWAVLGIAAAVLPMFPGIGREINGSRLWVALGPLSFQSGELAKIALVFFFASYLLERRELLSVSTYRIGPVSLVNPKHLVPVAVVWAASFGVLVLERDLGSSVLLLGIFLALLYLSTGRPVYQIAGAALFLAGAATAYSLFDHVKARISIWLDPFATYDTSGFQIAQALFSLGTGGIAGTGPGRGNPGLIPLAYTDFVFPAIGEEFGLLGLSAILAAYTIFFTEGIRIALAARNPFGKLLAAGLVSAVGLQTVLVLAGSTRLLPLTGLTTPFISYGGSSLLANFIVVATLAAISDQRDRPAPEQL